MPKASKFSPDEGITIYDLKDNEAVHYGEQVKGYVGKNLLNNTTITRSTGGVLFTVNSDKSITTSNTSTSDWVNFNINSAQFLKAGRYIISGITGGAQSTYRFSVSGDNITDFVLYDGSTTFEVSADSTISVQISVRYSGVDMSGVTFYPMIRLASISDNTYEPYLTSNTEIPDKMTYADNTILGAKNLLKNDAISRVINGVTWTINSDGSVTANGTATSNSTLYLKGTDGTFINDLPSRDLIFSGTPHGGSTLTYWMDMRYRVGSSTTNQFINDTGNGATIAWDSTKKYDVIRCFIGNGYTADNVTFYPMIRLASDTDSTYESYTMTNKELTEYVQKRVLSSSNNLNDITDTGMYGISTSPTNAPESAQYCTLIVQKTNSTDIRQIIYRVANAVGGGVIYTRAYGGSPAEWGSWFKFTGTVLT